MFVYKQGNIFESDADCIFNTVNCEGYMGKGIAYQFKLRYPDNNNEYERVCKSGRLKPGTLLPFKEKGKIIINFPTKDKWREPSKMSYITDGLDAFVRMLPALGIKKVAIPPLGCGNGGLNWSEVKKEIERRLSNRNIEIELYEPVARVTEMSVYDLLLLHVREKLEKPTSLRFQKIVYFTNYYYRGKIFSFSRGQYGPYSANLYKTAEKIRQYQKGNGFTNSRDTYNAIYRVICSKKVDEQYRKLAAASDKALLLVNSLEDDLILEGIATVFYLISDEKISKKESLVEAFNKWSDDKAARFDESIISECLTQLESRKIIQRNLFDEYSVLQA